VDAADLQSIEKFLKSKAASRSPVTRTPLLTPVKPPPPDDLDLRRLVGPNQTPIPIAAPVGDDALAREPLFGAVSSLNAMQTFESLVVGPFNRFAHAAGTSVVANPGSMYNPLVLYGVPGVGKTHFLNAIGLAMTDKSGREVFATTGCKLSWAVDLAVAANKMKELLAHAEASSGLLIDDVHLMTLTEKNQSGLSTLIRHFFDNAKPVIMTSAYPPKALQFLEEALKFQIGSGFAVEIKLTGQETQIQILRAVMTRMGFDVADEEGRMLQSIIGSGFLELNRWIRRFTALKAIRASRGENPTAKDLLNLLTINPAQPSALRDISAALAQMAPLVPSNSPKAKTLTLVFPSGHELYAHFALLQLRDASQSAGMKLEIKSLASQAYDPNQLYGVPAAIGESARKSGASALLMIGPVPMTQLAAHEGELYHALDHILASLRLALLLVPFPQIEDSSLYLKAVLDGYFAIWAPWQP
jgi:chromosomal replication initiator protein